MRLDIKEGRTYVLEIYGMTQQWCLFCHGYNSSLFLPPGNTRFTWSTWTSGTSRRKGKISSVYVLKRPSNAIFVFSWIFPLLYISFIVQMFFSRGVLLSASPLERQKQKGWKHLRGGKFPRQLLVARMGSVRIGLLPALTRLSAAFTPGAVHPLGRALPRDSALLSSLHRCCCRESLWNSA